MFWYCSDKPAIFLKNTQSIYKKQQLEYTPETTSCVKFKPEAVLIFFIACFLHCLFYTA